MPGLPRNQVNAQGAAGPSSIVFFLLVNFSSNTWTHRSLYNHWGFLGWHKLIDCMICIIWQGGLEAVKARPAVFCGCLAPCARATLIWTRGAQTMMYDAVLGLKRNGIDRGSRRQAETGAENRASRPSRWSRRSSRVAGFNARRGMPLHRNKIFRWHVWVAHGQESAAARTTNRKTRTKYTKIHTWITQGLDSINQQREWAPFSCDVDVPRNKKNAQAFYIYTYIYIYIYFN